MQKFLTFYKKVLQKFYFVIHAMFLLHFFLKSVKSVFTKQIRQTCHQTHHLPALVHLASAGFDTFG